MRFPALVVAGLLWAGWSSSVVAQTAPLHYLVPAPTAGQLLQLQQHFDVLQGCCGGRTEVEVRVDGAQVPLLFSLAPTAQFLGVAQPYQSIQALQQVAFGPDVPDAGYYTVAEIEAEIDALALAFPGLAQKVNLSALPGGTPTHQGRAIFALKVSDNVAADEDEPAIVLAAQHHARELNSPHMVIGAMQRVLYGYTSDAQLQAVVDSHELWFVPMVNPDGVHHVWTVDNFWRKNRRDNGSSFGVDNNRNYPFLWGLCGASTTPSSETYRGPSPASEPETQVMRNLIARLRPHVYLDFHSHGRDVLRMWAPCANVHPSMFALQEHYVDALRTPMVYDKRDPTASGESPEDHFASGGTLSFLVEVGTSFQPAFASTVTEEARVWPGVRDALTNWRPALLGHVRSAQGQAPLEATITLAPAVLNHGEVTKSRLRDGRYGLWLPLGTWDVTFAGPGHDSRTVTVTVNGYDQGQQLDVLLETSGPQPTLTSVGTGSLGTQVVFSYTSPGDAGRAALFGWSFGTAPGTPLGGQRTLPLNYDILLEAALVGNSFLAPTWVTLDAFGQASSTLAVPNDAWLVGLTSYVAGITVDPAWHYTIKAWSAPVAITIVP